MTQQAAETQQAADPMDGVFAALADPTRRAILARLATGEATAGEVAAEFPISAQAVPSTSTCWSGPA